jgi:hypothetical protein
MSFLDLYQGDVDQAAKIQPNEGTRLPPGFDENFSAAWSDGRLFGQSIARQNARADVLSDYLDDIRAKTGTDLRAMDVQGEQGSLDNMIEMANARVAKMKESYPDLDLAPLTDSDIDQRALAKAQAAHRNYEALQAGERGSGGGVGAFLGAAASSATDPVNIVGLAIAPETGGVGILGAALRWGALAGVSQAAIEGVSAPFKEEVQPGYEASGQQVGNVAGAFVGGAVLGGSFKALGNLWTRAKTGAWPTSIRDAGNIIESEANVANTNILPGAEGEVAHREALVKTIDDILAGRPIDVASHITPDMAQHIEAFHGSPYEFDRFDSSKIGTGEGAQSYGHGLYFAENEGVAGEYRAKLASQATSDEGLHWLDIAKGDKRKAEALYRNTLGDELPDRSVLKTINGGLNEGTVYKVRITADKERMLDLDKRLNEQAPEVQAALKRAMGIDYHGNFDAAKSERAWKEFQNANGKVAVRQGFIASDDKLVAQRLSDAGIPGSKYLDQDSRGAGDGTRNFVVFNDKDVQITHKNGKPVNAETRQAVVDQAMGLPPKQPELPLVPATAETVPPEAPGKIRVDQNAPQPALQTPEEMAKTLTAPDHQDAIRADIDRERAMGDVKVPGIDEQGNHTMVSVDAAMDQVDAYKAAADHIQACANPAAEAAE